MVLPASYRNTHTVSDAIYEMTKGFIDGSAFDSTCEFSNLQPPKVPVSQFNEIVGIDPPPAEDFINRTVPTDARLTPKPVAVSYTTKYEDIAAIALGDVSNAVYGDYLLPRSLPDHQLPAPNLQYPEAGYMEIKRYAGLDDNLHIPVIEVGTVPDFLDIPTLDYELHEISPLDAELPPIPTLPELELLQEPERLDFTPSQELLDAIDIGLAGNEVISVEAQQIMLDRADRVISKTLDREERKIFTAMAAAGFMNTNGPLIEALSELKYDASFKDREAYENMREEAYKRALAQVLEAVKSALALEAMNGAVHLSYAAKLVETLRFNVAMQVEYANLLIAVFNEQLKGVRATITAYEAYAGAVMADYSAYGKSIAAVSAVLDTNEAKVTAYSAQVGTIDAQADSYATQVTYSAQEVEEYQIYVQGILKNVDIARVNIESYAQATRAYSKSIDADKAKIEGYASEVRATGSATGVYEANYNAYAEAQSASRAAHAARRNWYTSSLQALTGEIAAFQSTAGAQRTYLQTLTDWTNGNASMTSQYASGVSAKAGYVKAYNRHSVSIEESNANIELAEADAEAKMDGLEAQATAIQEAINIGLESAEAQTAAGCAQAAYSTRSVSASMRSTAGMNDAAALSGSTAKTTSSLRSYAYNKTTSGN